MDHVLKSLVRARIDETLFRTLEGTPFGGVEAFLQIGQKKATGCAPIPTCLAFMGGRARGGRSRGGRRHRRRTRGAGIRARVHQGPNTLLASWDGGIACKSMWRNDHLVVFTKLSELKPICMLRATAPWYIALTIPMLGFGIVLANVVLARERCPNVTLSREDVLDSKMLSISNV